MKILLLHNHANPSRLRRTSFNHAFACLKYAPWHSYDVVCHGRPVRDDIRKASYDLILMDTSFLWFRWMKPRALYAEEYSSSYDFIAASSAVKIAFPQDDYDHSAILDEWLERWKVDIVYSSCAQHADVLYPRTRRHAEIRNALTGYVDDADIELAGRVAKPLAARSIDIGYRAADLPPQFGRFGRQKADIARFALSGLRDSGLRLDISTEPGSMIQGDGWFDFLGNCRFTLGCESGSSIQDPYGRIGDCATIYRERHPTSSFEEVERHCFPGQDGLVFPEHRVFSTISPRIFEAGLGGTAQILIEGAYEGILDPWTHYVPVDPTLSKAAELVDIVRDNERAERMAAACRERILGLPKLTYRNLVSEIFDEAQKSRPAPGASRAEPVAPPQDARTTGELHDAAWRAYVASVERPLPADARAGAPQGRIAGKLRRAAKLFAAYTIDFQREANDAGTVAPIAWLKGAWRAAVTIASFRLNRRKHSARF